MSDVARLITVVDIDDRVNDPKAVEARRVDSPREVSFSALHQAVLEDGRRLTLLDDRGWSVHGPSDSWQRATVEQIEADARTVVGPDEPFGSHSQADMESDHWTCLANTLRDQGLQIDPEELSRLPHDVELSERLRARVAGA